MLLTDKYADKIYGTITCYDRMIIQGYIPIGANLNKKCTKIGILDRK